MDCKYNLANNRQTKHLSNYDRFYPTCNMMNNDEENEKILLARAKKTLEEMPFFGINEYYNYSLVLFQRAIGDNLFKFDFDQNLIEKKKNQSFGDSYKNKIDIKLLERIKKVNKLDIELYEYGLKIFFAKLKYFKII